jgi:hemoglobin/transferrin/lactoferrin receptor protein
MTNASVYASHSWSPGLSSSWSFSEAARAGWSWLNATFSDKTFFPFPFDVAKQSQPVFSGSLGAVWNGSAGWRIASNAASGFRVPNVDDLGRVFDSAPGNLIVPNPDVKPEQTYNLDINISKTIARRLRVEGVVWGTLFRNAIVVAPYTLNGRDSILFDGRLSRVAANQNVNKARLWGGMVSVESDITPVLAAYGAVAYNKGRITGAETLVPLDHIPPVYGRAGVRYHTVKFTLEAFALFNGRKDIKDYNPGGEDNAQYAPANGMPAWWTMHLRTGYKVLNFLTLQAGVDNLMDVQYRTFASGINGPGRNIFVTGRVRF